MIPQENSQLTNVLDRLKNHIGGETAIKNRAQEIIEIKSDTDITRFNSALSNLKDWQRIEQGKKQFENVAVAYLINRLEETHHGLVVRPEQIEAVVALLEKDQIQARTGFGKSSIVVPIASVVGALSETGTYAVTTVSPELKAELYEGIEKIIKLLPETVRPRLLEFKKDRAVKTEPAASPQDQFKQLAKSLVENPDEELVKKQGEDYFRELLNPSIERFVDSETKALLKTPPNIPSITLFEENDQVFYTIMHPEAHFTQTIFDEIHVPRSRKAVYYTTNPSSFTSPDMVENYLFKRILSGHMKEIIETNDLLAEKKGQYWFKDDTAEKTFFDHIVKNTAGSKYLDTPLVSIAQEVGVDRQKLEKWFKSHKMDEDIVHEVLLSLCRAKAIKEGVQYQKKEEQQLVRDPLMGIALPSHQFSPEIRLGIQTWDNTLSFVDYFQSSASSTSFEGWVTNYLKGRLSGLTNNLFTPLLTNPDHPQKTSLAKFLEKQTGHEAVFIGERQKISPPNPQVLESNQLLEINLIKQLQQDKRLAIVFCFDENEAKKIRGLINSDLTGKRVIMADASITEEEARERYKQFANSENAVLISTGRVGVGVDLKNSQGKFTDHKSIIYGLPSSIDQIYQSLGRRRLTSLNPEKDFLWLLSHDQIKNYAGYLSLEAKEREKIIKDLAKKPVPALERLIMISENMARNNDEILVNFDRLYQQALLDFQKQIEKTALPALTKKLEESQLTDNDKKIIDAFSQGIYGKPLLNYFINFINAPADLYWLLKNQLSYIQNSSALAGELSQMIKSYLINPENINDWLAAKTPQFNYLLSQIILPQLKTMSSYNGLKEAKTIRFIPTAFLSPQDLLQFGGSPNVLSDISTHIPTNISPGVLFPISLPAGDNLICFHDNTHVFILSNTNTVRPIKRGGQESLDWVINLPDINRQITVMFS